MSDSNFHDILRDLEINIKVSPESDQNKTESEIKTPSEDTSKSLGQVSDAVTQTGVEVVGQSPSMAGAELHQVLSQSTAITVQNSINMQKQLTTTHQAVTTKKIKDFLRPAQTKGSQITFKQSLERLFEIMETIEEMNL